MGCTGARIALIGGKMNKCIILDSKLGDLLDEVDQVLNEEKNDYLIDYLKNNKAHINRIRNMLVSKTLENSTNGLLGIQRAISESDILSSYEKLYQLACDVERYYSEECKKLWIGGKHC